MTDDADIRRAERALQTIEAAARTDPKAAAWLDEHPDLAELARLFAARRRVLAIAKTARTRVRH
jgi:hypothetical protein